jgi:hypothetical protein
VGLFSKKEPEPASVAGVELRCEICKHTTFYSREAQLHTALASFFDLEWTGTTATCYVCARCGYVHWFVPVD